MVAPVEAPFCQGCIACLMVINYMMMLRHSIARTPSNDKTRFLVMHLGHACTGVSLSLVKLM
jgi:hypothetical protein